MDIIPLLTKHLLIKLPLTPPPTRLLLMIIQCLLTPLATPLLIIPLRLRRLTIGGINENFREVIFNGKGKDI